MPVTFLEHNLVLKTNIAIGTFQAYFLSSPHAIFDVASTGASWPNYENSTANTLGHVFLSGV